MLCFIIALKSKSVSNDWQKVSRLFEASLHSAYNQIDPDLHILVVCHETPDLEKNYDERVELINVDFSPPALAGLEGLDRSKACMRDKWKKLSIGMIKAGELNPDFVMIMDADDLVSCKLSQYANAHLNSTGWIFKRGYRYQFNSQWIHIDDNFNCGTNAIVSGNLIRFPESLADEEINQCVVLSNGHTVIEKKLTELGTPLKPLPFMGATYVYGHGDNDSSSYTTSLKNWQGLRFFAGHVRRTRPLSQKIRKEFSIL